MQKQYRWVPAPLRGVYANGVRWELQSLSDSPGYWKYEGRVTKYETYDGTVITYMSTVGTHDTMHDAARALLASVTTPAGWSHANA